jgi:excisionase family DNA binding protein
MVEELLDEIFGGRAAIGVDELATRLSFNRESLRRAIRRGRIGAVKLLGRWRIPRQALASYIDSGGFARRAPTPPRLGGRAAERAAGRNEVPAGDYDAPPPSTYDHAPEVNREFPF